jgi:hypothetical protein
LLLQIAYKFRKMKESTKIILGLAVTALCFAGVAYAINNPGTTPFGANGAIRSDAAGNVGIDTAPTAGAKLTIGGNVSWAGYSLTGGTIDWSHITSPFPAACPPNTFVSSLGALSFGCTQISWANLTPTAGQFSDGDQSGGAGVASLSGNAGLTISPAPPQNGVVTVAVNNAVIQQRVTSCSGTQVMQSIGVNGTPVCVPSTVVTCTASPSNRIYTPINNPGGYFGSCYKNIIAGNCGGKGSIDIYSCTTAGTWSVAPGQCNVAVMKTC